MPASAVSTSALLSLVSPWKPWAELMPVAQKEAADGEAQRGDIVVGRFERLERGHGILARAGPIGPDFDAVRDHQEPLLRGVVGGILGQLGPEPAGALGDDAGLLAEREGEALLCCPSSGSWSCDWIMPSAAKWPQRLLERQQVEGGARQRMREASGRRGRRRGGGRLRPSRGGQRDIVPRVEERGERAERERVKRMQRSCPPWSGWQLLYHKQGATARSA